MAHWLNWRTGIDLGAAREKVRVARALPGLPRISAALACGSISYAKVRAITRVATPEIEQRLLNIALAGTASHVERIVRAWRRTDRVIAAQEADARHLSRHLTTWIDDDGILVLRGRLTPEIGVVLQRALDAAADQLRRETKEAPETRLVAEVTWGQRRADALGCLAEVALAADLDAGHSGDRYQVVLHVEASASACAPARPDAANGPADGVLEVDDAAIRVSAETSQRRTCDASAVTMHHDADGQVLVVGQGGFTLRWRSGRRIAFCYPDGTELCIAPPQPRLASATRWHPRLNAWRRRASSSHRGRCLPGTVGRSISAMPSTCFTCHLRLSNEGPREHRFRSSAAARARRFDQSTPCDVVIGHRVRPAIFLT